MKKSTFFLLFGGGACLVLAVAAVVVIQLLGRGDQQSILPGKPPNAFRAESSPTPESALQAEAQEPESAAVTPTPPAPANLTRNPEGGYDKISLLLDDQGALHLVYYGRPPESGAYYHQQLSSAGEWSPPEDLTPGFDILWSSLALASRPDGATCVLWAGVNADRLEAYFQRCQEAAGGSFSPVEVWQEHTFDTRSEFSPLLLADGSVQAAFSRVGGGLTFGDLPLTDGTTPDHSAHLVQDAGGNYHLVWFRQADPYSLQYRLSIDGGAAWSETQSLTTAADAPDAWYDLAADSSGNLHLVWPGFGGGLYYRRWTADQGWSETERIGERNCPAEIAANAQGLARVAAGCWDGVFFFEQLPSGEWLPAYQLSAAGGSLDLAVDAGDVAHIVYLGENDIQYLRLQVGGR